MNNSEKTIKTRENAVRRKLSKQGYKLSKSRMNYSINNLGGYMIIDTSFNSIVAGENYNMSLEDIEKWINE